MQQFREFWPNIVNISHDYHAIAVRHSYNSSGTVVRMSRDVLMDLA